MGDEDIKAQAIQLNIVPQLLELLDVPGWDEGPACIMATVPAPHLCHASVLQT